VSELRERGTSAQKDVANFGLVRPPFMYLTAILIGSMLAIEWRLPFMPGSHSSLLGGAVVTAAVALFAYAVRTFRAAGTPVPGNKPTTVIVRTGPYRFSRNPIYLAFSLVQLGLAIWIDSLWLVGTLIAALAVMALVVIPREERYLERKFGAEYLDYKAAVRRWL
jgi:protein-S-isoprenylcysteine O-methyltransferase Ste14